MTIDQLRKAHSARPFKPFTLIAGDGTHYQVSHPEMLAMSPKAERTFIVYTGPREDDYSVLDLLLITAIQFGSGPKRRKAG